MRYLILSDIHSNLSALEAVLAQVSGEYEQVVCLGDIVGYGPEPNEAIDQVKQLNPVAVVRGNHDKACCGISNAEDFNPIARVATTWTRQQLRLENLNYLRGLDVGPLPVGTFQIVHGSILDEDEYVFQAREALESLGQAERSVTFFGHTHLQGGFALAENSRVKVLQVTVAAGGGSAALELDSNSKYLINPGSIGQPRDGDPRAGFAFFDDEKGVVEYCRVPYDIEATQRRMEQAGLPEPLVRRLSLGR